MSRRLFVLVLIAYLGVVLWFTLRPLPTPDSQPVIVPFVDTWRQMRDLGDKVALEEATRNVLLFIPFGYLLPASVRRLRGFKSAMGVGAGVSAIIELAQWLVVPGRSPSIDDVMYNTIGSAIGAALFILLTGLWRHRRDRAARGRVHPEASS
jgi:glycopeptide antibiotics resistance protein